MGYNEIEPKGIIMKFNIQVTRVRHRFFPHLRTKSELQQLIQEMQELTKMSEDAEERCRRITQRLIDMEQKADSK